MDKQDVMYMVVDELAHWVYTIEAKLEDAVDTARLMNLEDAVDTARLMNLEENQMYHHYVVEECTIEYGESWLDAWKKVIEV